MSIDFTQSMAANQAAASQSNFANLIFKSQLQTLEFPQSPDHAIFKMDVLPTIVQPVYGRAAVHRLPTGIITCPQGTFGKPCPICEAIRMRPREDKEFWSKNHAKERAFLNVVPVDDAGLPRKMHPDHQNSVYCYNIGASPKAKSGFWQILTVALSSPDPNDHYKRLFADWQQGMTLKLILKSDKFDGNDYMDVVGIEFIQRQTKYDPAQWSPLCYQFTELIHCLEYEEIRAMCPHLFGSHSTADTGYSPHLDMMTNSGLPDGVYPPPAPPVPPQGATLPTQAQAPQQGGFYPPAAGLPPVAPPPPQQYQQQAQAPPPQQYQQPAPPTQPQYPSTTGSPIIF